MAAKKSKGASGDIEFEASLHHTNAALSFYADGDAKITLAVDASQLGTFARTLTLLQGRTFTVRIPRASIVGPRQKGANGDPREVYR